MRRTIAVYMMALLPLLGCDRTATEPELDTEVLFTIEVSGETFVARSSDAATIESLDARLASGVSGVILGELAAGDGGFNAPWGWHWVPGTVAVADTSIELCDGRPSFVEADLSYWIDTVEAFCPWGATVVARDPA